jgi:hypothetical protein
MEASVIGKSHPSFGCGQAWFLFAKTDSAGRMGKLLLVEAKNAWAVQTLERIAADGRVAPDCELLSVHRQCPSIGIRSDRMEEVEYSDFVSDHVELSRVLSDTLSAHSFQSSLTDGDRARLLTDRPAPALSAAPAALPSASDVSDDVMAALIDLGFKKPQAKRIIDSIPAISGMSVEDALHAALQKAQAA